MPAQTGALELAGRVVDPGGTPVSGARVELQQQLPFHARALQILEGKISRDAVATVKTSREGEYRLDVPEAGMWQVEIRAPGKVPVRCRLAPLLENELLPDAVLEADAGFEIRVEDETGSPVPDAQVFLAHQRRERPRPRSMPSPWKLAGGYGRTGADGRLELPRRPDSKLRVYSFAEGLLPTGSPVLETGKTTLRLTRGRPVTIRLLTESGEPIRNAVLTASPLNWVVATTDAEGEATLFVEAGQGLPLTARRPSGQIEATDVLVAATDFERAGDAPLVREWRLPPPIELTGRVVDRDTREPVEAALVWTSGDVGEFRRADGDGRYRLVRGSADRWFIQAGALGYGVGQTEAQRRPEGPRVATVALAPAGALTGRVVGPEGRPIAKATVRVSAPRQQVSARTDAEGDFRLEGLVIGTRYELATEARGFAPDHRMLTLESVEDLEIVLEPGLAVTGRLVTEAGEPIGGATVVLAPHQVDPRARGYSSAAQRELLPEAESDGEGRFRVGELPALPMVLVARAKGLAEKIVSGVDLTDVVGELDLGDIELVPGVALHGVVRSRDAEPVAGAEIWIYYSNPLLWAARFEAEERQIATDERGRFVLPGLDGDRSYNLGVRHPEYVDKWLNEVVAGSEELFEIVLDRGARVSGRILDETGDPVEGLSVSAVTVSPAGPVADALRRGTRVANGRSRDDGSFEIARIDPGRVEISVAPGRGWIASDLLTLDLRGGEERSGLVLRVTTGSELVGSVSNEEQRPVVGATVRVSNRTSVTSFMVRSLGPSSTERTDGDGNFAVRGLDPAVPQRAVTIQHPDYAVLEEVVEIHAGDNRRDFVLRRGAVITGVVVTEGGEPVEGAEITLQGGSSQVRSSYTFFGGKAAESDPEGSFEIRGLSGGVYEVQARKPGFASGTAEGVDVGETTGASVTLVLTIGGTIRGRVLDLEPEELARIEVVASNEQSGLAMGIVAADGEYRIPNVGFSKGRVIASTKQGGRTAMEEFELDRHGGEAWVDLEFKAGSTLSGSVLLNGEPVANAQVHAQGGESPGGGATTDASGRFRIRGLEDGTNMLMVLALGSLNHRESVLVEGDTEVTIDIASVSLSGLVLAADDGAPLAHAEVSAFIEGDPFSGFGSPTGTDSGGGFQIHAPAGRRVRVRAKAMGYAEDSLEVETVPGVDVAGLELVLSKGGGLELDLTLWTGSRPRWVTVALVDASGNRVAADGLLGRPPGRFRLDSAPSGSWTLLVAARESAVVALPVTVPGPPVEAMLPQGSSIRVEVASPRGEGVQGKVRILSATGGFLRFPALSYDLSEIPILRSGGMVPFVPAGDWIVELIESSGAVRRQAVTTVAGTTSQVSFE